MATSITITLYTSTGTPLAVLTPLAWSVASKVNDISIAMVRVNVEKYGGQNITFGMYMGIERSDVVNGMPVYTEFFGMIRKVVVTQGPRVTIDVIAMDGMHILSDRIVAWYPDLPGYSVFNSSVYPKASSVLVQLWNTNIGNDSFNPPVVSAALTRRYGTSLDRWSVGYVSAAESFAVDYDCGDPVSYSCSGENLLAAMQKVADSGNIDFWVDLAPLINEFGVSYSVYYQLKSAVNRGVDRTGTVRMSQTNNTLGTLERTADILNSPSYIIANGTGKKKARLQGRFPTTPPTETDLREIVVNGGDNVTVNQLRTVAFRRYRQEQRKIESYNIEVLQSAVYRYGRDYFIGDLVTVLYTGSTTLTRKIYGVTLAMGADGNEEVQIDLVAN